MGGRSVEGGKKRRGRIRRRRKDGKQKCTGRIIGRVTESDWKVYVKYENEMKWQGSGTDTVRGNVRVRARGMAKGKLRENEKEWKGPGDWEWERNREGE